ncbi:protein of unknown function (plasmid) [Caballeronia sp. S22]
MINGFANVVANVVAFSLFFYSVGINKPNLNTGALHRARQEAVPLLELIKQQLFFVVKSYGLSIGNRPGVLYLCQQYPCDHGSA